MKEQQVESIYRSVIYMTKILFIIIYAFETKVYVELFYELYNIDTHALIVLQYWHPCIDSVTILTSIH